MEPVAGEKHVVLVVRWPTGGIRTYLKYVYTRVIAAGWRVTCMAPEGEGFELIKRDLGGPRFHGLPLAERPSIQSILGTVSRTISQPGVDVVHSHGLTAAVIVSPVAKMLRIPHLVTLHDIFHESQFRGVRGKIKRFALTAALSLTDEIQAVSMDAKANLMDTLPALRRRGAAIRGVLNGIDIGQFHGNEVESIREQLGLGPDVFVVGFFGRFMNQKGFRILVEAVRQIREERRVGRPIVVVARGSGGFLREDTALIDRLDLHSSFRFLPYSGTLAPTISACDCVVMPSLWEAGPLLAMEVMCAGVPLIASSCIGLREVIAGGPATVVQPGSARSLADAIRDHVANHAQLKECANHYAPIAQARFDVSFTAQTVLESLDRLSNRQGRREGGDGQGREVA